MIETRYLTGDDLDILSQHIADKGWTTLDKTTAMAIAEFNDGTLVGFLVLRKMPLVGPFWVREDKRGGDTAKSLVDYMVQFLMSTETVSYMAVADSPFSAKLCEAHGMEKVTSPVYLKKT